MSNNLNNKIILCPLCSNNINVSKNTLVSYKKPDQYELAVGIKNKNYFRKYIRCAQCTLVFSFYSRSVQAFNYLYEELYRKAGSVPWRKYTTEETFKLIKNLPPAQSETYHRVNYIKNRLNSYFKDNILLKKNNYKLLDIGGATGSFAYAFKDKLWKSYIIDPDKSGKFIENYGINFKRGFFKSRSFTFKFDLISLIYVLEHVLNPKSLLKEINRSLNTNGLIYIEVPDEIAFQKLDKNNDIFNSCHLFMFNPNSLTYLLKQSKFELMSLERSRTVRGHFVLSILAKKY